MSGDAVALALGTALAVGALAYVLQPLFFDVGGTHAAGGARAAPDETAIAALREIEFDRATGKLSETDYAELRRAYGERAVLEMRAAAARERAGAPGVDVAEERVRAYRRSHRECPDCGLRPETDAAYCSTCGAFLDRRCRDCGSEIREPGAAFCSTCGGRLGARARG